MSETPNGTMAATTPTPPTTPLAVIRNLRFLASTD
jgi:hypothetical protein